MEKFKNVRSLGFLLWEEAEKEKKKKPFPPKKSNDDDDNEEEKEESDKDSSDETDDDDEKKPKGDGAEKESVRSDGKDSEGFPENLKKTVTGKKPDKVVVYEKRNFRPFIRNSK